MRRLPACFAPADAAVAFWVCSLLLGGALAESANGQVGDRAIPSRSYYLAVQSLYQGNYSGAERVFRSELRGAIKTPQSRWIDSICYHAMLGEAYFLQGRNAESLEQFDQACKLSLAFPDWMMRVQFRQLRADANRAGRAAPWGQTKRTRVVPARIPATMLINQGEFLTQDRLRQGGVLPLSPQSWSLNVVEVVRTTALAIRRRNQLLGPLAPPDALATRLANRAVGAGAPPNHWSQAWAQLQSGIAKAGVGRFEEARQALSRAMLLSGEYDHPLTAMALLEQGRITMRAGNFAAAAQLFAEASYSAFYYEDFATIDEALRLGEQAHLIQNGDKIYPPLEPAARWAKRDGLDHIYAHMRLLEAENYAAAGNPQAAETILKGDLVRTVGRRDMKTSRLKTRYHYVMAWANYQLDRPKPAGESLRTALTLAANNGLWNFQIALAGGLYDAGTLNARRAKELYPILLRDPTANDWALQPIESLSVLTVPHGDAYDKWFAAAWEGLDQQVDVAFEVAERAKRHRFLASLPWGGRLLALRKILEAPEATLPPAARLQRQSLLVRYPDYEQLSQEGRDLRRRLRKQPLAPADAQVQADVQRTLRQWEATAQQREHLLRRIALGRHAGDLVVPPTETTARLQLRLRPGEVMVTFFSSGGRLFGFALTRREYTAWDLGPLNKLSREVAATLRGFGNLDENREVAEETIVSTKWRKTAARLRETLFGKAQLDFRQTKEMIVVPDDFVWYLPFEALTLDDSADEPPLIARIRVRYAPLAAMAHTVGSPRPRAARTGIAVGQLFPRNSDDSDPEAAQRITDALPGAEVLPSPLPGPAQLYAPLTDNLIVLDHYDDPKTGSFAWAPMSEGRRGGGSTLAQWMSLPYGCPSTVILPGFHTLAASGLKGRSKIPPGQDLFVPLVSMMSCGTRTVLMSRWRTGGQTAYDLVREFVVELPHGPAAEAWRRSVLLTMDTPVDADREPRIGRLEGAVPPKAEHPFFWSGYLLADAPVIQDPAQAQQAGAAKVAVPAAPAKAELPQAPNAAE